MGFSRTKNYTQNRTHSSNYNGHNGNGYNGNGKSASPKGTSDKGSLIYRLNKLLENIFSHKGMFWLGVAIAVISFVANCYFYYGLFAGVTDWQVWQLVLGAFGVSFGTCLFEVMPVIWNRSNRNALNQIFAAGVKPDQLPTLNGAVVGNADDLIATYRDSDRKSANFFKTMRWVAIGFESFMGVLFLGSVGTGLRGIMKLAMFIGSIFGVEWGVSLAVRAGQWELPPQVRKQLNDLLGNSDKPLGLSKLNKVEQIGNK